MPKGVVILKKSKVDCIGLAPAGTVTKNLMKWLSEKGYVEDDEGLQLAEERAGDAARDLPAKTW